MLHICWTSVKFQSQLNHYTGLYSSKRSTHHSAILCDCSLFSIFFKAYFKHQTQRALLDSLDPLFSFERVQYAFDINHSSFNLFLHQSISQCSSQPSIPTLEPLASSFSLLVQLNTFLTTLDPPKNPCEGIFHVSSLLENSGCEGRGNLSCVPNSMVSSYWQGQWNSWCHCIAICQASRMQ